MYDHFWYMYECFFLPVRMYMTISAFSAHSVYIQGMMFQHEVSILILWGWWRWVSVLSAWYFSVLPTAFYSWYFCILCHNLSQWTCTFSTQQACSIHIFALSTCNQGQFLPIKISGDMHVTTSCCLTVRISNQIAYILQMARSNALTCIYSGTKCNTREVI